MSDTFPGPSDSRGGRGSLREIRRPGWFTAVIESGPRGLQVFRHAGHREQREAGGWVGPRILQGRLAEASGRHRWARQRSAMSVVNVSPIAQ